ncbi:Hypothetical predicted protein [Olea europaea subsp. europaea]|uniref:Uncharacterized protein n=1 Tax=Olea europaea subsp. europaea TaxID=158383 RepID=A0A8S0V0D9_OLEEU|nr:Hypothetical predicted protein [Olea europaea subsp. europaea]
MRCKKHPADLSSSVGVCASCLRERLFSVIAAQEQALAQKQTHTRDREDRLKFDAQPPHLAFPRSVSPYISHRKSDTTAAAATTWQIHGHDQRFFSTPQVGPTGSITVVDSTSGKKKRASGRFSSLFTGLFRSKSEKPDFNSSQISDRAVSGQLNSRDSCNASPSWFSNIFPGRRKKQIRTFSLDENAICAQRRTCRIRDRGMSPVRYSEEDEHCHGGSSGYSSESSQGWKQTPRKTPAMRRGGGRQGHSRNVSHMAFCLSPLVRASPNRHWNQMGVPSEMVVAGASGETRVPAKPYLSTAASFGKNRSRKLADFGRYNYNN